MSFGICQQLVRVLPENKNLIIQSQALKPLLLLPSNLLHKKSRAYLVIEDIILIRICLKVQAAIR